MKSSKGVLGIVAGPRNSGNTAILVKEVLKSKVKVADSEYQTNGTKTKIEPL